MTEMFPFKMDQYEIFIIEKGLSAAMPIKNNSLNNNNNNNELKRV